MIRCLSSVFLIFTIFSASAQKISYTVSFPNIVHHEAVIEVAVTGATQKQLTFRMSRSSPGRYATHEFGKNVYDVAALDISGKTLEIKRLDGDVYQVPTANGSVKVRYTLYANHPDGTYAGIDQSSIQLNNPAAFMWVKELEKAPVEVNFNLPDLKGWTIATQLKPTDKPNVFTAPDLQYFMDSPVKIGKLIIKNWSLINSDNKNLDFRLALEIDSDDAGASIFADKIKKITEESGAVFGEFPSFDYGQYTFLASINPYVKGDGMEHRNSTMIALPIKFNGSNNLLGVFAHEFFHAWNVERIRPKSLEPFNYEKSNMSHELWFAEGFTQYYGELLLKRAGFRDLNDITGTFSALANTKENTPGAKKLSPAEASCMAVFVDAGVAVDKTNYPNTYTSYYPYGASIAMALDLELMSRKLSLDQYMKAVWLKFGKTEKPYVIADLQSVLESVTGDKVFAADFFKKYVNGHESFDYAPLFEKAGMKLTKEFAGQAWIGNIRYVEKSELIIAANTTVDTPLYNAGVDIDDQITKLDGKAVKSENEIKAILDSHKPGDKLEIEFVHRGTTNMSVVNLAENPKLIVLTNEKLNLPVTEEMHAFRKKWLDSKVK
ncbi:Predicted metalloprotease, contains C-terminal PDZ domain [Dyadobacter koreensis]|uniref:Predicted metalloprotease, contains C-terminal PDZ domain n=1 Tax=Dyadobacter koreensis TaxID=408657 RepID=A0A1H6UY77_9BACT|nr:PDZ domain-containing protein [Dyadobacter koreensis]SEI97353.1 Predicted metalloprotease, contains C-terminal PDZ domain [Dyadobacter koreensis]